MLDPDPDPGPEIQINVDPMRIRIRIHNPDTVTKYIFKMQNCTAFRGRYTVKDNGKALLLNYLLVLKGGPTFIGFFTKKIIYKYDNKVLRFFRD